MNDVTGTDGGPPGTTTRSATLTAVMARTGKEQLYRLNREKQLYGLQTTGTAVWIGEERNSSTD